MILSDVSKRIFKVDSIEEVKRIFNLSMNGKNQINVSVGDFKGDICYEVEVVYPVGDYFEKMER